MTAQCRGRVHLCGSVPLESAEEVFRAVSETLGKYLTRLPDGETGERAGGIGWQASRFLHHPDLEVVPDEPDEEGERRSPKVRPRAGVDPATVRFGRIGYADAARESWRVFGWLREEGVIPDGCRFQVNLPTPLAPIAAYVAEGQAGLEPAYEAAVMGELAEISAIVPHDSLAFQWDAAVELAMLEGAYPGWFDDPAEDEIVRRLLRIGAFVPEDVPLGYHLCHWDARHEQFVAPADTSRLVAVANRLGDDLAHSLDWIHLPVPQDRDDDGYFSPLVALRRRPETQLYLGLVHLDDGLEGARRRISAAKAVGDFGIAAECGLGRRPAEQVPDLLRLHAEVADAL
ncbi:MAG: hypothetical protein GEV03_03630 [Streptosporangiales bacterium]|nr:hypothetical protein [Streptosporangiales bacterium]